MQISNLHGFHDYLGQRGNYLREDMLLTTLLDVLAQLKYHGSHLTQKKNKQTMQKLIKNYS